jgi:hypothetical protein
VTSFSISQLTGLRGAEIHENGADAHQPIMPRFTGSQYLSMKDLTTNSDQNYTVAPAQAPMLTKCGSQYSWMIDSAPNNVERDTIAPTQTTILTSFESQYSAVGDLANNGVEHHIAGHVQAPVLIECESRPSAGEELAIDTVEHHIAAPVQTRTLTKCDLCSEKGRSCNGNQANGKSCNVCIKAKQLCSFLPRKYACGLCHKHFTRQADLNTHNTRKHKQLSLEGPKESASTKDTSQTPRRLRKDSQQSAPIRDSSRPSKRARKNPKKQRYVDSGDSLYKMGQS